VSEPQSYTQLCRQTQPLQHSLCAAEAQTMRLIEFVPSSSMQATMPVKQPGCLVQLHLETQSRPCQPFNAQDTIGTAMYQYRTSAAMAAGHGRQHKACVGTNLLRQSSPAKAKPCLLCKWGVNLQQIWGTHARCQCAEASPIRSCCTMIV
jgi:hypothetical protein